MEFSESRPIWGLSGFIVGVLALVVVGLLVSGQFDPPSKSVGTTVGEIAAEIKSSAKRALSGAPAPEPVEAQDPSVKDLLQLVLPVLAAMAAILGAVGVFRKEPRVLAIGAIALGIGAILMQYVMWLALLFVGAIILVAILNNIGEIFA